LSLYGQTKVIELKHVQLLHKEALPVKIGVRDDSPMVC